MDVREQTEKQLFTLRVILGVMIAGVVLFSLVVLAIPARETTAGIGPVLLVVLAVMGVSSAAAFVVLRNVLTGRLADEAKRLRSDAAAAERSAIAHRGLFTLSILGGALAEGFGFFGAITYMLARQSVALAAPAIAVLLILALMPTAGRLDAFCQRVTGRRWNA